MNANFGEFNAIEFTLHPHNTDINRICQEIDRQEKLGNEIAILMAKPIDKSDSQVDFRKLIAALICENRLQLLCTSEKQLSEQEIAELYASVFDDTWQGSDLELIKGVRVELTEYMTSGSAFSYLIAGPNANQTANDIRKMLRTEYAPEADGKKIKNIVHVPEPEELGAALATLFDHSKEKVIT